MTWDDTLVLAIVCPRCNAYKDFTINDDLKIEESYKVQLTKTMFSKLEKRIYGFGKSGQLICGKCGKMIGQYVAPQKKSVEKLPKILKKAYAFTIITMDVLVITFNKKRGKQGAIFFSHICG